MAGYVSVIEDETRMITVTDVATFTYKIPVNLPTVGIDCAAEFRCTGHLHDSPLPYLTTRSFQSTT
jgi:hypothetical protein